MATRIGDRQRLLYPRIDDLRAQFEAQLRCLDRFEDGFRRLPTVATSLTDPTLRQAMADMLANNGNIREILTEMSAELSSNSKT
jgi:hypothetical protein